MSKSTLAKISLAIIANLLLINYSALAAIKVDRTDRYWHRINATHLRVDRSSQPIEASVDEVLDDIVINRVEKLKKFVDRGGSPNRYLHAAINSGSIDCVELMLARGANVNLVGEEGLTPVMISARVTYRGGVEMTKLLINKGANVNARAGKGSTALIFAAWGVANHYQDEYVEVVKLLIKHGAKVNVKNKMGDTPLTIAKSGNWKKIVATLKNAGAKS
ncbi:ankyrin repeat domain-containing protein [Chamaesiphon sp. VAR_48_metabat_135_sub]|uniref:ankyrin repeat domain-containing protein n=1 Tax=Chamaesiphon sp. VAR_48_metabat_135_sub TaxID=2964699 RepID=UPI002869F356|nr:ankyrin repeat domain-containing protein [Chamaesiphon sp. VAR_48_metabat_135_sub]